MRRLLLDAAIILLVGCGGSVDRSRPAESNPTGAGGSGGSGNVGGGAGDADSGTGGSGEAGSGGTGGVYDDPGCPDVPPIEGVIECDPLASISGCSGDLRCVPYVTYADDCGTEVFGTRCTPAGFGIQGDPCLDESSCAARHVCVTTGEGSQCVQLCDPDDGSEGCPPGLLCWWLDVQGSNVCF